MSAGQELAIKRVGYSWRVYEVIRSNVGPYAVVLRDADGEIRHFGAELTAREFIESIADATEVDYPS